MKIVKMKYTSLKLGHGAKSRTFNFLVFCINLHFLDACHLMFFRVALLSFNEYDIWAIKRYSVTFRAISADKKRHLIQDGYLVYY